MTWMMASSANLQLNKGLKNPSEAWAMCLSHSQNPNYFCLHCGNISTFSPQVVMAVSACTQISKNHGLTIPYPEYP